MSQNLFFVIKKRFIDILKGVLNLSSTFTSSSSSITDTSGNGFDATLKTGRYTVTDGTAEYIVIGDVSGFGGATRILRAEILFRASGAVTLWVQKNDTSGDSVSVPVEDVNTWNTVSVDFTGYAINGFTNVQFGYSINDASYTAGDWAEITLIGDNGNASAEVTIAHYYCNLSSDTTANGLNNLVITDVSGNGYHGYFVGGEGATAEQNPTPQIAGMNYNQYRRFTTSNYVILNTAITFSGDYSISMKWFNENTTSNNYLLTENGISADRFGYQESSDSFFINDSGTTRFFTSGGIIKNGLNTIVLSRSGTTTSIIINGITKNLAPSAVSNFTIKQIGFGDTSGLIFDINLLSFYSYKGFGKNPWENTAGSNDGTESGTFTDVLVCEDESSAGNDVFDNAIELSRPNTRLANLVGDGDSVYNAAQTVFDTVKTVAVTIYNDGVAKTVVDLGTPTVGTTTTDVTSSGFTSPTYYVNGVNTTTLSAGFNRVVVVSTVALATDNIEQLKKSGDLILSAQEWDITRVTKDYSNKSGDLN